MAAAGKPSICIVSPGTVLDNNGNWHTAARWAHFLRDGYDVAVRDCWTAADPLPDLMILLHARRSAPSLAAFLAQRDRQPALLLLTGTDVYHDIHHDAHAAAALHRVEALAVLQPAALAELPAKARGIAHVIYQSAPALPPLARVPAQKTITMVGHLRAVKDPATFMRAAALVTAPEVRLRQIGGVLDPELGQLATRTQEQLPHYGWLGAVPRDVVREEIRASHALAICSTMEGGANVIVEAVTSGVPVLASDISGNRGMLGDGYGGYFPVGDSAALARLIDRSVTDAAFMARLRAQCAARAPLFAPEAERAALQRLVDNLVQSNSTSPLGKTS